MRPESEGAENLLMVILGEQAVIIAFFLSGPMWQISLSICSCEHGIAKKFGPVPECGPQTHRPENE
jgi:hypothetical protein